MRWQQVRCGVLAVMAMMWIAGTPAIAVAEHGERPVVEEAVDGVERGVSNADVVAQDRGIDDDAIDTGEGAGGMQMEATEESPVRQLPEQERTLPGGHLAVIGYIALWLMLGVYLWYILRRQRRLQDEIDALDDRITGVLSGEPDAEVDGQQPS